jgi:hypothetical protein
VRRTRPGYATSPRSVDSLHANRATEHLILYLLLRSFGELRG